MRNEAVAARVRNKINSHLAQLEKVKQRLSQIELEQIEEPPPQEGDLRRDRREGIIMGAGALILGLGAGFFVDWSLRAFLPGTEFSTWLRLVMDTVIVVAVILAVHFILPRDWGGNPRVPAWLKVLVCGVLAGAALLALPRAFTITTPGQSPEVLRELAARGQSLGSVAFVLLGIGMDLLAGICGSLAFEKLMSTHEPLAQYREQCLLLEEKTRLESQLAELKEILSRCG